MTERAHSNTEKALRLRKRVKGRKPAFVRPESWRYVRLKENWRRPRGLDHKIRKKIKGWPPSVNVGYRGPKVSRGLHPSGYREVLVYNAEELKGIDAKTHAVRIAHTVGKRKRTKIITEAKKKKITVLNVKAPREAPKKEEELVEEKPEEKEEPVEEEVKEKEAKKLKQRQKRTRKNKEKAEEE